jgi:tryptophan synthase alpha chain
MNSIDLLFQRKPHNVLSIYFTAGFPQRDDTPAVIEALRRSGVDMIEIGIPFSDPVADGTVIQSSSAAALRNGMTVRLLFEQLAALPPSPVPLLMMSYLNPIMQYGFENFCRDCQRTGISGMIIPDLPFSEYLRDYRPIVARYGLHLVLLITPETSDERIRRIDEASGGFIYMVSSAATTGSQTAFDSTRLDYFRRIHKMGLRNPLMIGFGISNKATLDAAFAHASGAIIGSKFVELLSQCPSPATAVKKLFLYLQENNA